MCQSDYKQVYILMDLYVVLVNSFYCVFLVNIVSLLFVCLFYVLLRHLCVAWVLIE